MMSRTEIIVSIIIAVLGSAGLNGLITHMLYNSKLKKEQKMRAKDIIWEKIVSAFEEIRQLEQKAKEQEIFDFESIFKKEGYTDFFKDVGHYPAIMDSFDTFFGFFKEVNDARGKLALYIDPEVGAYLYYMHSYSMKLMEYMKKNNLVENYPLAGCFFFQDILNWQTHFDDVIVKRLNRSSYKLYSEHGEKWEKAKKKVEDKLWNESVLCKLINNIDDPYIEMIKGIFADYV